MIKIRDAVKEDLLRLSELDKHIGSDMMLLKIKNGNVIVAVDDGHIIGWLRYNLLWDSHPFMTMLYLIEGYRSKGFGTELVSYWEKKMEDGGHRLLITSTRSDEEAQHFYRKLGYIDMGGFIPPGEPLELMMYKEI